MAVVEVHITKERDDELGVLRASVGGDPAIGFYLVYRGDAHRVLRMLKRVVVAFEREVGDDDA